MFSLRQCQPLGPRAPQSIYGHFHAKDGTHSLTHKVGFRTLEFRPHDGIYLNGTKLVVKGTNRHCFHPETGRTTNRALSVTDAKIIKGMNMNAVRCHYPSDKHFLEVCDSIGLLYLDEFPGWQTAYDDSTARKLLPELYIGMSTTRACSYGVMATKMVGTRLSTASLRPMTLNTAK